MLFDGLDTSLIDSFGEAAMGQPLPIFYPSTSVEQAIDGIVSQTARPEDTVPGAVTRLFIRLADLTVAPERKDVVEVRDSEFSIERIDTDDIGGAELLLREK